MLSINLETAPFLGSYAVRVSEMVERRDARREGMARGVAARSQRPRTLTLSDTDYAGDYVSEAMGTMEVRATTAGLELAIGALHATVENFTRPESVRVELIPLRGEVVVFSLDPEGRPASLTYAGEVFHRR